MVCWPLVVAFADLLRAHGPVDLPLIVLASLAEHGQSVPAMSIRESGPPAGRLLPLCVLGVTWRCVNEPDGAVRIIDYVADAAAAGHLVLPLL